MNRSQRVWRTVGITVAVVIGVLGLAMVALVIAYAVALNSWASNK